MKNTFVFKSCRFFSSTMGVLLTLSACNPLQGPGDGQSTVDGNFHPGLPTGVYADHIVIV